MSNEERGVGGASFRSGAERRGGGGSAGAILPVTRRRQRGGDLTRDAFLKRPLHACRLVLRE